jgi:hypothetical protein
MWSFWPARRRSNYQSQHARSVAEASALPVITTRDAFETMMRQFDDFAARPGDANMLMGTFADYSCTSPEDRADRGVTVHLNCRVRKAMLEEAAHLLAHELEARDKRVEWSSDAGGDLQLRVPYVRR